MLPKKITIGCFDYSVEEVDEKLILDNTVCRGIVNLEKHEIKVSNDLSEQGKQKTLWHEIVHAIFNYRNINIDSNTEEMIADELALGLYGLCKNNGLLPGQSPERLVKSNG